MKRSRVALLISIIAFGVPLTEAQEPIIIEGYSPIQRVFTSVFANWPGTGGMTPIDVALSSGRIWLVWPEALISLNRSADADTETLLAYFNSQNALDGEALWNPEAGAICGDGIWRGIDVQNGRFWTKNPVSGEVSGRFWELKLELSRTPVVYPIDGDSLLVIDGLQDFVVNDDTTIEVPPLLGNLLQTTSIRAVASESRAIGSKSASVRKNVAAWWDADLGGVRIFRLQVPEVNKESFEFGLLSSETLPGFPEATPTALCWAGDTLVCGYPDSIVTVYLGAEETPKLTRYPKLPMPSRWYKLRGSPEGVLLHEPGSGVVLSVGAVSEDLLRAGQKTPSPNSFRLLLKNHVLDAGNRLVAVGQLERAEAFYGWALPLVRDFRSQTALDEYWPYLEEELYKRRNRLRLRLERR